MSQDESPQQFFETFVKPSYERWLKAPTDLGLASAAVHQANVMLERVVRSEAGKLTKQRLERRRQNLNEKCPDFALVRDVDDAHKHLELTRPGRQVTTSDQTGVQHVGGSWGRSWRGWGNTWGGASAIVVRLDDGTERPLSLILENVIAMWKQTLRGE